MKNKAKILVVLLIAALVFGGWCFDSLRVREFAVEVVSVSPDPGIADGQTPVTVRLRVTRSGEPCADHVLCGITQDGGTFKAKRVTTDENGEAEFVYYPYLKSKINALTDVRLSFSDESNSLFIAVPARAEYVLPMVEAKDGDDPGKTNEGMFG